MLAPGLSAKSETLIAGEGGFGKQTFQARRLPVSRVVDVKKVGAEGHGMRLIGCRDDRRPSTRAPRVRSAVFGIADRNGRRISSPRSWRMEGTPSLGGNREAAPRHREWMALELGVRRAKVIVNHGRVVRRAPTRKRKG